MKRVFTCEKKGKVEYEEAGSNRFQNLSKTALPLKLEFGLDFFGVFHHRSIALQLLSGGGFSLLAPTQT